MKNITQSATKLVLLYLILILGLLALFAGGWSVVTGDFNDASKVILASFGSALTLVLGFYFAYKGETPKPPTSEDSTGSSVPFAGK